MKRPTRSAEPKRRRGVRHNTMMAPRGLRARPRMLGVLVCVASCTVPIETQPRVDGGPDGRSDARAGAAGAGGKGGTSPAGTGGNGPISGTGGSPAALDAGTAGAVIIDPPGATFTTLQRVTLV